MAKTIFNLERSNAPALVDRLEQLDHDRDDRVARRDFLKEAFSQLGLPLPENQEYIETVDCGHLLFLNDAGCTIRLEQADKNDGAGNAGYVDYNSEFVLQPLGRIDGPGLSLCVYPGLISPWNEQPGDGVARDLDKLSGELKDQKIHFFDFDTRGDNIGYLPFTSPAWPRGVPVVIDPGAVARLSDATSPIKRALDKVKSLFTAQAEAPVRQGDIYGDLRGSFTHAIENKGQGIETFWTQCIAAKKTGLLQSSWTALPANFKDIPAVATAYERRLRAQVPAFRERS